MTQRKNQGIVKGAKPKRRLWRMKRGGSPVSKEVLRRKKQCDHCKLRTHPLDLKSGFGGMYASGSAGALTAKAYGLAWAEVCGLACRNGGKP